jgi:sulfoxide reductase catalytic subunit YedY
MLIKRKPAWALPETEVTPESAWLNRRQFIKGAAAVAGAALLAGCRPEEAAPRGAAPSSGLESADLIPFASESADELGAPLTSFQDIITYNNYYEFTTDKRDVAPLSSNLITNPWQVEVTGHVRNPGIWDIDQLRSRFDQEERIYRLRCVEAWSMVVPWNGFPLRKLLEAVEPTSKAQYVAFQTLHDPAQMPGQRPGRFNSYDWPYREGLRLDEALNDLTLLATGIYGNPVLPQNGAPVRLVVPWKYGFKSIKSIVRIALVEEMPPTLWSTANAAEYGFYANVNPDVAHPRWSQASERRIGEGGRRATLLYNGYAELVADLYAGVSLDDVGYFR